MWMERFLRTRLTIAVVLFASLAASAVFARDYHGSVIYRDGRRLDNVTFSFDKLYKVLTVSDHEKMTRIGLEDLAQLLDDDGKDITRDVTGRPAVLPVERAESLSSPDNVDVTPSMADTSKSADSAEVEVRQETKTVWHSMSDPVVRAEVRKQWSAGLRFSPNFSIPIGTWYDGFGVGIGFEGDLQVALTRQLALRMLVSKSGVGINEDLYLDGYVFRQEDMKASVWRFYGALEWYKMTPKRLGDLNRWYGYIGLGVAVHSISLRGLSGDDQSKFAMTIGGGYVHMLSRSFGLDFSASGDILFIGTYESDKYSSQYGDVQTANLLDFRVGIVMMFPTEDSNN